MVCENEIGVVACHYWDGKYVIHSDYYNGVNKNNLREIKEINKAIDNTFKNKGVNTLYTWAENDEQDRYARFLGYEKTGNTVNDTFVEKDYPYEIYEYKKELM